MDDILQRLDAIEGRLDQVQHLEELTNAWVSRIAETDEDRLLALRRSMDALRSELRSELRDVQTEMHVLVEELRSQAPGGPL